MSPLAPFQDLVFSSKAALFKSQQVNAYFIEHTEAPRPGKRGRSRSSAFCHLMGAVSNLLRGQSIHRWNGIPFFWFPISGGHCTQAKQSTSILKKKLLVNSPLGPKKGTGCKHNQNIPTIFPPQLLSCSLNVQRADQSIYKIQLLEQYLYIDLTTFQAGQTSNSCNPGTTSNISKVNKLGL